MADRSHGPPGADALRVLMTTEGTYPFVVGGVSSWCELLVQGIGEVRWQILPVVGQDRSRAPLFELPPWATLLEPIELWSNKTPRHATGARRSSASTDVAARLVRDLLGWNGDLDELRETLVWCRRHRTELRAGFRSTRSWESFLHAVRDVIATSPDAEVGRAPDLDTYDAARLYQTTYWLARTAASPTPDSDVLLVTAAGWAALPSIVHRALFGTPMVLVEHGIYVREAYLANVDVDRHGGRFFATRLARGLARAAYAGADVVSPVTDNHAHWERSLGVHPERIRVIYNGVSIPEDTTPAAAILDGRLGRPDRSAEGRPHDAARGRRGGPPHPGGPVPALRPRPGRPGPRTAGRASSCIAGSSSATGSGSWGPPPIRTAPCAMRTSSS